MLNDRERRVLARIERHLRDSDPDLARLFDGAAHPATGTSPRFLLIAGLAMLVLGCAVVAVPVAIAGMVLSIAALVLAHVRPNGAGFGYA